MIALVTLALLLLLLVTFGRRTPRGRVDHGRAREPVPIPLPLPDSDAAFGTAISDDGDFNAGGGSFGGGGASGDWNDDSDCSDAD